MSVPPYKPIPVIEARSISERYGKHLVVILGYDAANQMTHTTTYGSPVHSQYKDVAAQWGDICTRAVGADVEAKTNFEDYRATDAADNRAKIERLTATVERIDVILRSTSGGYMQAIADALVVIDEALDRSPQ